MNKCLARNSVGANTPQDCHFPECECYQQSDPDAAKIYAEKIRAEYFNKTGANWRPSDNNLANSYLDLLTEYKRLERELSK